MRSPVALQGPHVAPVAVEPVLEGSSPRHQTGHEAVPEVGERPSFPSQVLESAEEGGGPVGEDLHGHHVAGGSLGLVAELLHHTVAPDGDDTETPRLVAGRRGHGHVGAGPEVGVDQVPVVEAVDGISAEHEDDAGVELGDEAVVAPQGVGVAMGEAGLLEARERVEDEETSLVRSRSQGRPLARCSSIDCGWYCWIIQTSSISLSAQLLSGKSMRRYEPPKGSASLARLSVSGPMRLPAPPARRTASTRARVIAAPPGRRWETGREAHTPTPRAPESRGAVS
jgi:hypothetical protein